uniref:Mitochondrial transcription termination factor 1 n=1 Tax=Sphenodon punctatus TaxID=8508 RepID=A0A8D0HN91_SPHPU
MATRGLVHIKNLLRSNMNSSRLIGLSAETIIRPVFSRFLCLKVESHDMKFYNENSTLVNNLTCMGVDVSLVRKRHPSILRRPTANQEFLKQFLQTKGVREECIASIISRYPLAIVRSSEILEERWKLWRNILKTDMEIVHILERCPESFFRSNNNDNIVKNTIFFSSLGLTSNDLSKILTRAPRAFSSTVELNKKMTDLLTEICLARGGENAYDFVQKMISKNTYIFSQSTKQVEANVEFLQSSLNLNNEKLLSLLLGRGARILHLSNIYMEKCFANVNEKLSSCGYTERQVEMFVLKHPRMLRISPTKLNDKLDYFLKAKFEIKQIGAFPCILDKSLSDVNSRIKQLKKANYNFSTHGIGILTLSKQRFEAKLIKIVNH